MGRSRPRAKQAPNDLFLREARLPIVVTFLAGGWLTAAPFVLGYSKTAAGAVGYWNDVTVGVAIAVVALVRLLSARGMPWLGVPHIVLGVWLVVAPLLLGYNTEAASGVGKANDVVVGIIVAVLAGVSTMVAFRRRRARQQQHAAGR